MTRITVGRNGSAQATWDVIENFSDISRYLELVDGYTFATFTTPRGRKVSIRFDEIVSLTEMA